MTVTYTQGFGSRKFVTVWFQKVSVYRIWFQRVAVGSSASAPPTRNPLSAISWVSQLGWNCPLMWWPQSCISCWISCHLWAAITPRMQGLPNDSPHLNQTHSNITNSWCTLQLKDSQSRNVSTDHLSTKAGCSE